MENYFFSIPIYRFSEDAFYAKAKALRDRSFMLDHLGVTYFDNVHAYSWEFNEIVGWLRLYFHYSLQVDLMLYRHKRKNWEYGFQRKKYEYRDRLTEFFLETDLKNEALTESIINKIEAAKNSDKNIRAFHLDFREFRQVANAVDWEKIKRSSSPEWIIRPA